MTDREPGSDDDVGDDIVEMGHEQSWDDVLARVLARFSDDALPLDAILSAVDDERRAMRDAERLRILPRGFCAALDALSEKRRESEARGSAAFLADVERRNLVKAGQRIAADVAALKADRDVAAVMGDPTTEIDERIRAAEERLQQLRAQWRARKG